jgi:hypothetical protein
VRALLLTLAAALGCAAHAPDVPLPTAGPGIVAGRAVRAGRLGDVQPIVVALTNGRDGTVQIDPRQVIAVDAAGIRIAPLPPGEAARRAGGRAPGALKGGVVGAAEGGALGALGGVIAGAIQGGIGAAAAVGSAVGAALGAITGVVGGARGGGASHEAEFRDRALDGATLAPGASATGYVYYPAAQYSSLDVLAVEEPGGGTVHVSVPVE